MTATCTQFLADFYIRLAWLAFDRGQAMEYTRLMNLANACWLTTEDV